ncbi:patatin-domain-containing protein, partial [Metschnikowia bicuspidata]
KYATVVYVCDTPLKLKWTATCITQGDCILLLADADDDECATYVGDYERLLLKLKTTARTDLCLIHPDKLVLPGLTSIWLRNRIWVQDHQHITMDVRARKVSRAKKKNMILDLALKFASKANPSIKFQFEQAKARALQLLAKLDTRVATVPGAPAAHKNDFMRLARILSNEAVGLVLGGGGLRGISHVGVVTALEKHSIPVDIIGGTSIGLFVGGLYAKENNIVSIYGMTKKFSRRVGSIWRNIFDLTYPVTLYITGYEFNRGIWKVFGYHEIEDFWIKYFCNSTNITNSTMEIHERGYAWRFIRASMSLAGLLPPIAFNGSMLLDGGYLDNLPVMEMKNRGAKYVIAVDVGS